MTGLFPIVIYFISYTYKVIHQGKANFSQETFAFSENNRTFVGTLLKIRIYGKLRKARIA